jgi:glutaminyl-tRNA synthetase
MMSAAKQSGNPEPKPSSQASRGKHFVEQLVTEDLAKGKFGDRVQTRFPPEPNGYLHIGHAKSICLNFGMAATFGGVCNLRFDDTNPIKEETEYVRSIEEDLRWLDIGWNGKALYASDYFDQLYDWAIRLIKAGDAFVCDLTVDQIREFRGTLTTPGKESPFRNRTVEENLDLFDRMRNGEFPDGSQTLRAKVDMAANNLNLRDPVMYRILHASHHRTKDKWCIYPMYDFTHGQSDSIENVTHSICTLEFEDHRPLYDWYLEKLDVYHPRQIEFARLNLTHTVMSKRKLLELVEEGHVNGWDDPRMPTLCGLRRRGYTPESIRRFCDLIGVAKFNGMIDIVQLENCLREHLNQCAPRVLGVLDPLKVVIENYPEEKQQHLQAINNPQDPEAGQRTMPFGRELYIERSDFLEDPPKKFFRLAPGREVRLRYAYFITCHEVIRDAETNEIIELRCTYDPETLGGKAPDGRKVKGTIHWVSVKEAVPVEVRLYDYLFAVENPYDVPEGGDWRDHLNPGSRKVLPRVWVEPSLAEVPVGAIYQFERNGYFCVDPDSRPGKPVFNRTVTLRDRWTKMKKREKAKS